MKAKTNSTTRAICLGVWMALGCVAAANADYVAYALSEKKGEQPLPENIDNVEAKELVNLKWGEYTGPKSRIAVLGVDNKTKMDTVKISGPLGDILQFSTSKHSGIPVEGIEAIITDALHRSGRFRVVERQIVDKQIKEQDFGNSGRVAQPSSAKIGKILGAQYQMQAVITHYEPEYDGKDVGLGGLVGGTAGKLLGGIGFKSKKSMVGMNFRLVDATTSEVTFTKEVQAVISDSGLSFGGFGAGHSGALGGFMSSYSKTPIGLAVIAAVNKGVFELVKQVGAAPVNGSVIKVAGQEVYINLGQGSVAAGDMVKVYSRGEELVDPDTGISLGAEESELGVAEVTAVKEKFSVVKTKGFTAAKLAKGDKVVAMSKPAELQFAAAWGENKSANGDVKKTASVNGEATDW